MSTTAATALLLLGGVLLAPVTLTAVGARRRGQPWHIALVSAVLFPAAWTLWYVADERPFSRRHPFPGSRPASYATSRGQQTKPTGE